MRSRDYIADRMEEERRQPTDGLIYSLMMAEVEGQKLTDEEVIANTIITLIGGHETTTNLIASGFLTLLRHPESFELLRSRPEIVGPQLRNCFATSRRCSIQRESRPPISSLVAKPSKKARELSSCWLRRIAIPIVSLIPTVWIYCAKTTGRWHLAGRPISVSEPHWRAWKGKSLSTRSCVGLLNPVLLEETLSWRSNAGLRSLTSLKIGFDPGIPSTSAN